VFPIMFVCSIILAKEGTEELVEDEVVEHLKERLHRALKAKAILLERSKQLAQQVEDLKRRDDRSSHVVEELLNRQRELNYMLHRANSVLQRMQEANNALSSEFTELIKELPQPQQGDPEWSERVSRINELFKRTGDLADEAEAEIFGRREDSPKNDPNPKDNPNPQSTVSAEENKPETTEQNTIPDAVFVTVEKESQTETVETEPSCSYDDEPETAVEEPDKTDNAEQEFNEKLDKVIAAFEAAKPSEQTAEAEETAPKRIGWFGRLFRRHKAKNSAQPQQAPQTDVVPIGATVNTGHADNWDESEDYESQNKQNTSSSE